MPARARIEVLYFDSCPNYRAAVELVHLLVGEGRFDAELSLVQVEDPERAREVRFLGSPTVRVNGRDVEPGADRREDYVLACRVYQTEHGATGVPDPRWIVWALESADGEVPDVEGAPPGGGTGGAP